MQLEKCYDGMNNNNLISTCSYMCGRHYILVLAHGENVHPLAWFLLAKKWGMSYMLIVNIVMLYNSNCMVLGLGTLDKQYEPSSTWYCPYNNHWHIIIILLTSWCKHKSCRAGLKDIDKLTSGYYCLAIWSDLWFLIATKFSFSIENNENCH